MLLLYSLILYLLTPIVVIRLLWRSLWLPEYRRRINERFSIGLSITAKSPIIWIHAVSVGETQAAFPLVSSLRAAYPTTQILFTTTTPTGAERVRILGSDVIHRYAPYDLPIVIHHFLNQTRPLLAIIMETELWPNLIYSCRRRGIPIILANARLSIRSLHGYQYIPPLARFTIRQFNAIAAQSIEDAQRFQKLGALPQQIHITGNLKFELSIRPNLKHDAAELRKIIAPDRPVWIAASTHRGEEILILNAHALIRHTHPNALLILVPRHPERFQEVMELCRSVNFSVHTWSDQSAIPTDCAVYLGDTMGHLLLFYAAADVAFVGGSLVDSGGHNPLEPAALGIPVIFGPYSFNFSEINRLLLAAGGAYKVSNEKELAVIISAWLGNPQMRLNIGEQARLLVESKRGALATLMQLIAEQINTD